jgi:hypothetical protein
MTRAKKGPVTPRFRVLDKVRVKAGVPDPDFPDIPLGGWTGTITEIIEHKGRVNCVFELDERSLAGIHPIFKQRCEIDGLDYKLMGVSQEDIEPETARRSPSSSPRSTCPVPFRRMTRTIGSAWCSG